MRTRARRRVAEWSVVRRGVPVVRVLSPPPPSPPHPPFFSRGTPRTGSLLLAEAEALRNKHRDATNAVSAVERQISDLEKKLATDYGPAQAFYKLSTECIEFKPGGEFSYELCPFDKADQKDKNGMSTSIGKWQGFGDDKHTTMKFDNGQHCWNAGARTLTVTLSCAAENKILGVEEPEVCKYAMRLETPAACKVEHLEAAKAELEYLTVPTAHDEL
jgi:protein kinase C substrate 80K-H